jgi:hypothetical protein
VVLAGRHQAGQAPQGLEFRAAVVRLAVVEARGTVKGDPVALEDPVQAAPAETMETVVDPEPVVLVEMVGKVRVGKARGGRVVAADPEGPISTCLRITHSLHPWLQAR